MTTDKNNFVFSPRKPRGDRGDVVFTSCSRCFLIDTQAIRSKILDLAMRGKLTEQLPEDGTAEELYRQIQAEKQALIKAGKIKKEKPLPEIAADEVPFEIPVNWKWVGLSSISKKITDGTHNSPINTSEGEFMYVTAKNIKNEGVVLDDMTYVTKSVHEEIYSRCNPEKGDVLLIKDGATTGIVTVNNVDEPFSMLSSVALIKPLSFIEPWYVVYAMRSSWFYRFIRNEMTGVGITRVVLRQIQTFTMPLPPLAEQHRIVERIKQAFSALDTIDALQAKYADNLAVLKSKLIDAAIQGKLTEQLPEDGTAEELYRQIQTEKQALITAGKIKKEKPFSTSPEFLDYPFTIPASWKFVRFGDLMINRDSERIPVSVEERRKRKKEFDYYGASGIIDKIDDYLFDKELLLIGEDGANLLARSSPIAFIASGQYWVNNHAHVLDVCGGLSLKYICQYINSISLDKYVTGTAQPKLNQENMNAIWIALPPLAEQRRIVERLDEVLKLVEAGLGGAGRAAV